MRGSLGMWVALSVRFKFSCQSKIRLSDCQMVKSEWLIRECISTTPEPDSDELFTTPADACHCSVVILDLYAATWSLKPNL